MESEEGNLPTFEVKDGDDWNQTDPDAIEEGQVFRVLDDDGTPKKGPRGNEEWIARKRTDDGQLRMDPWVEPENWSPAIANIEVVITQQLKAEWRCRNRECGNKVRSFDQALCQALAKGEEITVMADCCGKAYALTKGVLQQPKGNGLEAKVARQIIAGGLPGLPGRNGGRS